MGDIIGLLVLLGVLFGIAVFMLRVTGMGHPFGGGPLNDPRVEWQVYESTGYSGMTDWKWSVTVGDNSNGGREFGKWEAMTNARKAARRLIGEGERYGKTRPCPLCGKPSGVGKETDTEECARLLQSSRAELPKAIL